jgi:peptidoglycan/LPS O-acetylase OafA/YrhL
MNRFKQIDILRAIAVFLVLGRHMAPCPPDSSGFLNHVTIIWAQGGWIGVDLFFVLSGFLVSGLLFREHEKFHELHIGHFLIRRGFKIYPPFWLLIGFTVIILTLRHQHLPLRGLASELLFVQNYGAAMWSHTWSLAVEEHFYLLLAFGFFVLARRWPAQPFTLVPVAFIAIALLSLILRIVGAFHSAYDHKTHLFPSHLRLDGLFFGVLLSYWFHRNPIRFRSVAQRFRYPLASIGALLLLPAFCFRLESTPFIYTYGLTLFYLGSGCLLVSALGWQTPNAGLGSAVAYIGSHSYSVYLWHVPVAVWGTAVVRLLFPQHNWYIYAATYLLGSIAFGVSMAILTEFPILRIRDRLFPSRGTPLSSDATGSNKNAR